jgi:hypothetical protein
MSLEIIDIIDEVDDGKHQERDWQKVQGLMLHRTGVNLVDDKVLGYDAVSVVEAFLGRRPEWPDVAKATGGQNAYTLLIGSDLGPPEHDGRVWQALPLDEIGHHGRRFSRGYIGIGFIADPRRQPLSKKAWDAGVELCAKLCVGFAFNPYKVIKGHGEVPGAHGGTKAPGQPGACPGLSREQLNAFRHDTDEFMRERGLRELHDAGLVWDR